MILDRLCPVCEGTGDRPCLCDGRGLVSAEEAARWLEMGDVLVVVPPPPAEMRRPCGDCAFRADSPEHESGLIYQITESVEAGQPFHCHVGMHMTVDGRYQPREVDAAGAPVGHPICAGWQMARLRAEARQAR